jgi:hypothetical protein
MEHFRQQSKPPMNRFRSELGKLWTETDSGNGDAARSGNRVSASFNWLTGPAREQSLRRAKADAGLGLKLVVGSDLRVHRDDFVAEYNPASV